MTSRTEANFHSSTNLALTAKGVPSECQPIWESPRRLHIEDMPSTAAMQIHGVSVTCIHSSIHSPLMEWKWMGRFSRVSGESIDRACLLTGPRFPGAKLFSPGMANRASQVVVSPILRVAGLSGRSLRSATSANSASYVKVNRAQPISGLRVLERVRSSH